MTEFNPLVTQRNIPAGAPLDSKQISSFMSEVTASFATLQDLINNNLLPIVNTLPGGGDMVSNSDRTNDINPLENGLDASQIYVHNNASPVSNTVFWDSTVSRPVTIKEALLSLSERIEQGLATIKGNNFSPTILANLIKSGYPLRTTKSGIHTQTATEFWLRLEEDMSDFGQYTYSGTLYGVSNPAATRELFKVIYDNGLTGASNVHFEYASKRAIQNGSNWYVQIMNASDAGWQSGFSSYGSHDWTTILGTEYIIVQRSI